MSIAVSLPHNQLLSGELDVLVTPSRPEIWRREAVHEKAAEAELGMARRFWDNLQPHYPRIYDAVAELGSIGKIAALPSGRCSLARIFMAVSLSGSGRDFLSHAIPILFGSVEPSNEQLRVNFSDESAREGTLVIGCAPTRNQAAQFVAASNTAGFNGLLQSTVDLLSRQLDEAGMDRARNAMEKYLGTESSQELKVLTFNIWGVPRPFGNFEPGRYGEIAGILKRSNMDVVALQEVCARETNVIRTDTDYPYQAKGGKESTLVGNSGVVTMSRHRILYSEFLPFHATFGLRTLIKGALLTRIELPDGSLINVFNVHLYSQLGGDKVRARQLGELGDWVRTKSIAGVPSLVMGDMNFKETDDLYTMLQGNFPLDTFRIVNQGDRREVGNGAASGNTFDPVRNHWAGRSVHWTQDSQPRRLDYIMAVGLGETRPVLVQSSREFVEPCFNGRHLSDHYGMSTRIRFM